jgi:hypothetical protein
MERRQWCQLARDPIPDCEARRRASDRWRPNGLLNLLPQSRGGRGSSLQVNRFKFFNLFKPMTGEIPFSNPIPF